MIPLRTGLAANLRKIGPDEVEAGMTVFSVEVYESGAVITYYGEIEEIAIQKNGARVSYFVGMQRYKRKDPFPETIEIYEVMP